MVATVVELVVVVAEVVVVCGAVVGGTYPGGSKWDRSTASLNLIALKRLSTFKLWAGS